MYHCQFIECNMLGSTYFFILRLLSILQMNGFEWSRQYSVKPCSMPTCILSIFPTAFFPHDAMLARYMPSSCLSHACIVPKQLNVASSKQCRMIVFWCQRSRRNSNGVTPKGGAIWRWDRSKLAIFDQYLAISQKRCKIGI